MKVIFGVFLVVALAMMVQAGRRCPQPDSNCICPLQYDPVCSTEGCNYSNTCFLQCVKGHLWYKGACNNRQVYG